MSDTDPAQTKSAIDVDCISVRLAGRRVLDNVSLSLRTGEVLAIAGPNGAGKSTLLRSMAGVQALDAGRILLGGQTLDRFDARSLARSVAYLPQDRVVAWPISVEAVVSLGRHPHLSYLKRMSERDESAVRAAMEAVEVAHLAERPVTELSGGERARVLVARALAQEAPVLLADEPTSGLDPAHALTLFETLGKLAHGGRTIAVALHDLNLAMRYCDKVILLKEGCVEALGPSGDVMTHERLAEVFGIDAEIIVKSGIPTLIIKAALT